MKRPWRPAQDPESPASPEPSSAPLRNAAGTRRAGSGCHQQWGPEPHHRAPETPGQQCSCSRPRLPDHPHASGECERGCAQRSWRGGGGALTGSPRSTSQLGSGQWRPIHANKQDAAAEGRAVKVSRMTWGNAHRDSQVLQSGTRDISVGTSFCLSWADTTYEWWMEEQPARLTGNTPRP